MADNVTLNSGTGGATLATDDIGTVHYQRVKFAIGSDGNANDAIPVSNGLDTSAAGVQAVGLVAQVDETSPSTVTENQFGAVRMSTRRALYVDQLPVSTAHLITAATANPTVVKASAGKLRSVNVLNKSDVPLYVKFHNQATSPTAGTGVVFTVGVQAGTQRDMVLPGGGREFTAGIAMTVVRDAADAGTTAVAAEDGIIEVSYE
jgi:hypothetical protein